MPEKRPDADLLARIRSNSTAGTYALCLVQSGVDETDPALKELGLLIAELIGGHDELVIKCIVRARAGALKVEDVDTWFYQRVIRASQACAAGGHESCGKRKRAQP